MRIQGWTVAVIALLCLSQAALAASDRKGRVFKTDDLLARSRAPEGRLYTIEPTLEQMIRTNRRGAGKVMMYYPERLGAPLSVTLPVPADGYYRVMARHVYGAWAQGRYCYVKLAADGVPMPGQHHGWYSGGGAPKHWPKARTHLVDVTWGVIYLRKPSVELVFTPQDAGLLGTERLGLITVAPDQLKPEDKERRVPVRPVPAAAPPVEGQSSCTVKPAGDLKWVVPVRSGKVTVDGELGEWDLGKPGIVANARAVDIDKLGWKGPDPQGDNDLSAAVAVAWDDKNLYLAARVTDDQLAETAGQKKWASPWGHDTVVVLVRPPVWLTTGARAVGSVPEQLTFGLSYYSADTGPRPLGGGATYVARKSAGGYLVEAAIPFRAMGFRPEAGDRVPFMLIFSDIDPGKTAHLRFDQYGLPTRGHGGRGSAQLRLLGPKGWGGDLHTAHATVRPGGFLRYVGTIDVVGKPVRLNGVELVSRDKDRAIVKASCRESLTPGGRYKVEGGVRLPKDLAEGSYDLRLIVE